MPPDEAARNAFGDLAVANNLLRDYSRQSKLHSGGVTLSEIPAVTLPTGIPLSEMDTLAILAGVMLDSRFPPARIRRLVDSLERRDPNKARAAILAARVAHADQDQAAFDQAVNRAEAALVPGDWEQRRALASVLLVSGLPKWPDERAQDRRHSTGREPRHEMVR